MRWVSNLRRCPSQIEIAGGKGARAKNSGADVCVCCFLWWASNFADAYDFWKLLGAARVSRDLGEDARVGCCLWWLSRFQWWQHLLDAAGGWGARAKDLGDGVCVCCCLEWVSSRWWYFCVRGIAWGPGRVVKDLGEGACACCCSWWVFYFWVLAKFALHRWGLGRTYKRLGEGLCMCCCLWWVCRHDAHGHLKLLAAGEHEKRTWVRVCACAALRGECLVWVASKC